MIGGCPRSGTTALQQVFNSNSSVLISSEENLLNSAQVLGKLLGTRERREKIFAERGTRDLSDRETLNLENALESCFSEKAVWPTIRYWYEWHHAQNCEVSPLLLWGDKFPYYYRYIDHLLGVDGVRYLHITRNPFDVVNSMLRRTAMARQGKDWWRAITEIDVMIDTWEEAYRTINQLENNRKVFHLNYEELVFDFETSVSRLNQFLGSDLLYRNILINSPKKHYDRSYLNDETIALMLKRQEVSAYIEEYAGNPGFAHVSASLEGVGK